MKTVVGYCDPWSVAPGETVRVMVSTYGPDSYDARLVRVICGDDRPSGAGFREAAIDSPINGTHAGGYQPIAIGSHVVVPDDPVLAGLANFTVQAYVWPSTPGKGRQGLIARRADDGAGFALSLDDAGALTLDLGDGAATETVATGQPMVARSWYFVAASFDAASGAVRLVQRPLVDWPTVDDAAEVAATVALRGLGDGTADLLMAALPDAGAGATAHFNGKIDRPRLARRALSDAEMAEAAGDAVPARLAPDLLGAWDFAADIGGEDITDTSENRLDGAAVNLPSRGVKGHNWSGREMCWRDAPEEYAAIHFHDDDLYDAGWDTSLEFAVPEDALSGAYAVRLEAEGEPFYVMFFVRPPRGTASAPIAFLASTATYMAYGNYHWLMHEPMAELKRESVLTLNHEEAFLQENLELGLSTYDTHSDGSGVRHASRLRPILNMSPMGRIWSFNADSHILDWFEAKGHAYDVITDDDLHEEGLALLAPYRVVVTGTHPEYWSTPMWRAMAAYQRDGGRLMYMGGNGFYWRVAYHAEKPGVIELRRTEDGARYWAEEPGEYWMAWSGEYGGLWRRAGIAPNTLVGIGTRATGFDRSSYYRRTAASFDPRAAFIFEGLFRMSFSTQRKQYYC